MEYKICKRCVMDSSDPTIKFDENGFCNYCTAALKEKDTLPTKENGKKEFEKLVELLKKDGKNKKYDCVLGISGGIDSSYLAYLLSQAGLRILGVHIDGGWNTDISNKNVRLLSEKCGFDLEIIKINEKEMMDLQKAYFISGVVNQDVPQDHAFFAELYKYMEKHNIKYFISGHNWVSESITPKGWGYDAYDSDNIKDIHKKFGKIKLKTYPLLSFFESILPFDSNRVQLFTVLCKEMETPLKLAPEIRSVLDVLELLYSPLSPSVCSFEFTARIAAIVTSQLGLKRFPTYFLFPKIPFFSNRHLLDA